MSTGDKGRDHADDGRQEILERALDKMSPAKRKALLFISNDDIIKSLDSANSAVTCVGCRSAIKARLTNGMQQEDNPLLTATFDWTWEGPTPASTSSSSSSSSSSNLAVSRKKNRDYVRFGTSRRKALGRFDTGPAASLALLMSADLIRAEGVA